MKKSIKLEINDVEAIKSLAKSYLLNEASPFTDNPDANLAIAYIKAVNSVMYQKGAKIDLEFKVTNTYNGSIDDTNS